MAKKRNKPQASAWKRSKAAGRKPVMLQFTVVDHSIISEAAVKSGLSIAGFCQLAARVEAYAATGKTSANRQYHSCVPTTTT